MKFKLVETNPKNRIYKSDVEITKFPNNLFNWEEEIKAFKTRLKEGVEMLEDKCFYVVISDANTHIERLVFAGMRYKFANGDIKYGAASMLHINGRYTMMIHGGDSDSVYDDQVYLRHLSIFNNLKSK